MRGSEDWTGRLGKSSVMLPADVGLANYSFSVTIPASTAAYIIPIPASWANAKKVWLNRIIVTVDDDTYIHEFAVQENNPAYRPLDVYFKRRESFIFDKYLIAQDPNNEVWVIFWNNDPANSHTFKGTIQWYDSPKT